MKAQRGFSLIELLIVVAIILIIAAIAIPSLLRARIAANESAMVGDIRTVIAAEAAFHGVTTAYGALSCLSNPESCFTGAGTTPMVDYELASGDEKNGYRRVFADNGEAVGGSRGLFSGFCYGGLPRVGISSYSGDDTGVIVRNAEGAPCCVAGANDMSACETYTRR